MSSGDTSKKLVSYTSDTLPPGETDWAALDAMTDEEAHAAALSDPDGQPLTHEQLARMRRAVPDVVAIRAKLGLSQTEFGRAFGIPVQTLRDWEQGRARPDRATVAYLRVIEREPEAVRRALMTAA